MPERQFYLDFSISRLFSFDRLSNLLLLPDDVHFLSARVLAPPSFSSARSIPSGVTSPLTDGLYVATSTLAYTLLCNLRGRIEREKTQCDAREPQYMHQHASISTRGSKPAHARMRARAITHMRARVRGTACAADAPVPPDQPAQRARLPLGRGARPRAPARTRAHAQARACEPVGAPRTARTANVARMRIRSHARTLKG